MNKLEQTLGSIGPVDRSLETDIKGANAFGIDSALVGTGVATLASSDQPELPCPTYHMHSICPETASEPS